MSAQLAELLVQAPRDCWLALNDDESKIVGRGTSVAEAVLEANKAGVDDPVIIWSPKSWITRILEVGRED